MVLKAVQVVDNISCLYFELNKIEEKAEEKAE